MSSLAEAVDANRRRAILMILVEGAGSANDSIIHTALDMMGHNANLTRAYVRDQLRWLETAGAVTTEFYNERVMVARLTARGGDCAEGRVRIEGIARPGHGD